MFIKIDPMNNSSVVTDSNNTGSNGVVLNTGAGNSNAGVNNSGQNQGQNQGNIKNSRCNLIVNYLPQSLKEHDFNQLFSRIGPLKTCKLMYDRTTGYSFGYGFVEYVNEDDARKAIESYNGYSIEHKRLKVAYARPNCEDTKNTNLYIRNIPLSYDEQQLHHLFSQYGEVVQVRLLRDQNTTFSRRIGFVIMATKQMAQMAIQNLDNTIPPNGGTEPIYVKYADEEGKKRHGPGGNMGGGGGGRGSNQLHQNNYNNTNNNYLNQQNAPPHGFNFNNPNSFMMGAGNNQNPLNNLTPNTLNLGKIKTNRSSGHQNRYNPIGGALNNQGTGGINNGGANNNGNANNNYNPWTMATAAAVAAAAIQQPYSNFGTPNAAPLVGNSGFDNLINTIGGGGNTSGNASYGSHHPNMHHHPNSHPHQMQQQHLHNSSNANNYLNLNPAAAAAMAAAAALGNSSSTGNLLDVGAGGGLAGIASANNNLVGLDGKGNSGTGGGHIIYVYGIGAQATESDLYSLFSSCGRILRVNVIKNQKTGQCKGYGFVVFETYDEAYYAVHNMNGYMYNHRPLQVQLNAAPVDS